MILVANPAKPLELTAKGTPRRNVCLAKYEAEIEAIYAAAESSRDGPQPPSTWTPESTLAFVHSVVEAAMDQVGGSIAINRSLQPSRSTSCVGITSGRCDSSRRDNRKMVEMKPLLVGHPRDLHPEAVRVSPRRGAGSVGNRWERSRTSSKRWTRSGRLGR